MNVIEFDFGANGHDTLRCRMCARTGGYLGWRLQCRAVRRARLSGRDSSTRACGREQSLHRPLPESTCRHRTNPGLGDPKSNRILARAYHCGSFTRRAYNSRQQSLNVDVPQLRGVAYLRTRHSPDLLLVRRHGPIRLVSAIPDPVPCSGSFWDVGLCGSESIHGQR